MRASKNQLAHAVLAFVLVLFLAACGGGTEVPDGADGTDGADGKLGTLDTAIEESQPSPVRANWGHVIFDNDDDAYLRIAHTAGALSLSEMIDDSFSEHAEITERIMFSYQETFSGNTLLIFYFDNPDFASADGIESLMSAMEIDETVNTFELGDGATLYFTIAPYDAVPKAHIFDIVEGEGVYVTGLMAYSTSELLACCSRISFIWGGEFSEAIEGVLDDASTGSMRIGSAQNGYVDIPSGWTVVENQDNADAGMIQYTDGRSNVISMLGLGLSEDPNDTAANRAWAFAQVLYEDYEQNPSVVDRNLYSQPLACGLDAYIVATEWEGGAYMYQFSIAGDDGVYYISCREDEDIAYDLALRIIDTFDPSA